MIEITAKNKYRDMLATKQGRVRFVLMAIVAISLPVLSYFLYHNILTVVTLAVSMGAVMFLVTVPPKEIKIRISDEKLVFDNREEELSTLDSWAVVDLGSANEIVIKKAGTKPEFITFYIDQKQTPEMKKLVIQLTKTLPYNSQTGELGFSHVVYRSLGVK